MITDDALPPVGQEIDLPVVPSPMRTTLFPESFVVLTPSSDVMEIAFLRQELAVLAQKGQVSRSSDGSIDLQVQATSVVGQIQDLGHIRMPPFKMLELAKSIILHAQSYHGTDVGEFLLGLADASGVASTESGAT
jgi:hypothetical protein